MSRIVPPIQMQNEPNEPTGIRSARKVSALSIAPSVQSRATFLGHAGLYFTGVPHIAVERAAPPGNNGGRGTRLLHGLRRSSSHMRAVAASAFLLPVLAVSTFVVAA